MPIWLSEDCLEGTIPHLILQRQRLVVAEKSKYLYTVLLASSASLRRYPGGMHSGVDS